MRSARTALERVGHGEDERALRIVRRAKGLGWFSIALGAAEILAPEGLARAIGIRPTVRTRATMIALGAREIMAGVGILRRSRVGARPTGWVWARVAGDIMDLALLGDAMSSSRNEPSKTLFAAANVLGVTVLDAVTAVQLNPAQAPAAREERKRLHLTKSVTINRPVDEITPLWRDFWAGEPMSRALVRFVEAAGGRGTEIHVQHGRLKGAETVSMLRKFKQVVETGEVMRSDASVHRGPHPARPSNGAKGATR
jgi:hypothetical protein